MAGWVRPRTLAAAFGVYFLIVAYSAWTTANQTGWKYEADLTRWVYTTYMLVSAVFLVGLAGLGISIRRSFGKQIRDIERRLAAGSGEAMPDALPPPLPETPVVARDHVDKDIDELLESLSEVEANVAREAQAMDVQRAAGPQGSAIDLSDSEIAAKRTRLIQRRKFLGRYITGPGIVVAVVLGVSGLMLPGSDVFAQSAVALNTALILGIAYSWLGIGGYIAATIAALVSSGGDRRRR